MRLAVTGGGTGGHVFPALEVARLAKALGHDVLYLGSLRGQERRACEKAGIPFQGFPSEPLYSIKTPRGWKAAVNLLRSVGMAGKALKRARPDVVFSTGGYSSAPVVAACKRMGIPYVVHEQNSVPGRSNLMAASKAAAVATTFHAAEAHFPQAQVVRTGLPVREELRQIAASHRLGLQADPIHVLAFGGSQGAAALNEAVLATATRMTHRQMRWIHVTGKAHFERIFPTYEKLGIREIYEPKSYLEGAHMGEAYARASLVVSRSGAGTLSELAAFRLPSVLIPYPLAFAQHQLHNAEEFASMGAAVLLDQEALHPARLQEAIEAWLDEPGRLEAASQALAEWDQPDAAQRILDLVEAAASRRTRR